MSLPREDLIARSSASVTAISNCLDTYVPGNRFPALHGDNTRTQLQHSQLDTQTPRCTLLTSDSYYQSHARGQLRDAYGGNSWQCIHITQCYDLKSAAGNTMVHPSWVFHRSRLARRMTDFGVGGLRLYNVNNIGNYDFVRSYKRRAWELHNARYNSLVDRNKFLVIGEELSMSVSMVRQGVLDSVWNEP